MTQLDTAYEQLRIQGLKLALMTALKYGREADAEAIKKEIYRLERARVA